MISRFAGIDWSGAKGPRHQGIQIAVAKRGRGRPARVVPGDGGHWGREAVFDWLCAQALDSRRGPLFAGIDFAFSHPFHDEGTYFPGLANAPRSAPALWANVESLCRDVPHLYGGAVLTSPDFGPYYLSAYNLKAARYKSRRRRCEHASREAGLAPSLTFKAIGADNVATGSMAGMRLLHALKARLGARLAVWPFDEVRPGRMEGVGLIMSEIYPSLYFRRAGLNPQRLAARSPAFLNAALAAYDSLGVAADFIPLGRDADEADAMIAAAALRWFAARHGAFDAPPAAQKEGWIFGVPDLPDAKG